MTYMTIIDAECSYFYLTSTDGSSNPMWKQHTIKADFEVSQGGVLVVSQSVFEENKSRTKVVRVVPPGNWTNLHPV